MRCFYISVLRVFCGNVKIFLLYIVMDAERNLNLNLEICVLVFILIQNRRIFAVESVDASFLGGHARFGQANLAWKLT